MLSIWTCLDFWSFSKEFILWEKDKTLTSHMIAVIPGKPFALQKNLRHVQIESICR